MSKKVLVPIANGSEEIEAVCIIDVLRRAGAEVTVASVAAMGVTASRGLRITADALIADCQDQRYDLIALPGGMPGAEHLRDAPELTLLLRKQHEVGGLFAAICASPAVVLGHHGLLEGLRATCYPSFADRLQAAQVVDEAVVRDGPCITSRGPGTALAFALALVEALFGESKAKEVATGLLFAD